MLNRIRRLSLSSLVILFFFLGILTGLFFGEHVAWMNVIGDAFIKLLQMTIIPYIIVSLTTSLGNLSYDQAKLLGIQVGKLMLLLWALGLLAIFTVKWIFPPWQAASFFSASELTPPPEVNLLDLYVPTNPFHSMSNSYIPAIVLFSVATGIALIGVKKKKALMEQGQALSEAFNKITGYVVKLMPLGIFAMTAATAGTMDFDEFRRLQVYLASHVVITLLLTYWVLPAAVAFFTPFSFRDIAHIARDALVTAFAAGNIFVVLPILIERTKELYKKYGLDNEQTENSPDIIIPVVFSFPNLGKLLTIVFVLFAAWFAGREVDFQTYIPIALNGLISLFGSVYLAVPMLLDALELPSDLFQLYVVSSLFSGRFTSLLAAMNVFVLAVGGTAMLAGVARIDTKRLILYAAMTPLVFGVALGGTAMLLKNLVSSEYVMDEVVGNMRQADTLPELEVKFDADPRAAGAIARSVDQIKASDVLRVGFAPDRLPFSYFNRQGELVGFDIEMAKRLAADLDVSVQFVPFTRDTALTLLDTGKVDMLVSGLQVTAERLSIVKFTNSVLNLHYAVVVKDHRADEFADDQTILEAGELNIAMVGDYSITPKLKETFPNVTFTDIDSHREFFHQQGDLYDGLLISAEAGKSWTLLYPQYTTLFKREEIKSFPAAYAVEKSNLDLLSFLNGWLELMKMHGVVDRLYDYWIQGKDAQRDGKRWSVIKDVLHWVD